MVRCLTSRYHGRDRRLLLESEMGEKGPVPVGHVETGKSCPSLPSRDWTGPGDPGLSDGCVRRSRQGDTGTVPVDP